VVGLEPPHAAIKHAVAIAKDTVRFFITILSLAALDGFRLNCNSVLASPLASPHRGEVGPAREASPAGRGGANSSES
jgi:hypothetical protein